MNLSRPRHSYQESHPRRPERPLDQWLLTGRQLMDGVAGVRPRQRRIVSSEKSTGLGSISRWVGERLERLFDEEDNGHEPWQETEIVALRNGSEKQPLKAVSRRGVSGSPTSFAAVNTAHSDMSTAIPDQPNDVDLCAEHWLQTGCAPLVEKRQQQRRQRLLPRSSRWRSQ